MEHAHAGPHHRGALPEHETMKQISVSDRWNPLPGCCPALGKATPGSFSHVVVAGGES